MRLITIVTALLGGIIFGPMTARATNVCGTVSGVWDSTGSPYHVTCNLVVPYGQTLTILPGVDVLFNANYKMDVLGSLFAVGTAQDSILFAPAPTNASQRWWGIRVETSGAYCNLNYCIVERGWKANGNGYDYNGGGLVCNFSTVLVDHCVFRNNTASRGGAIAIWGGGSTISNSLFVGNHAQYGGAVFMGVSNSIIQCTFDDNVTTETSATVYLGGGVITSSIISNASEYGLGFAGGSARFCCIFGSQDGPGNGTVPAGFHALTLRNMRGDSCDLFQNVFLDPGYVNASNGDYHLLESSHCIDAGDTALPHDTDGSIADIGVYPRLIMPGITLVRPNGGEMCRLGESDTIRWTSARVDGTIRMELNRAYPEGAWEILSDNTANDGEEPWMPTEPVSSRCRIRVSVIGDTLVDVSNANFSIVPYLNLTAPNGGEQWALQQMDTVRWTGSGMDSIRIELTRNFPAGAWEVLNSGTANDGREAVVVSGVPSTRCRIRISPVGGEGFDISNADFSLVSASGYLALVQSSNPDLAILAWNAGLVDSAEASPWYHFKNFGGATVHVSPSPELNYGFFSRTAACNSFFTLAPGQMSSCSLRFTFAPMPEGIFRDTLRVASDAVNAIDDSVRIPLIGSHFSAPQSPQISIRSLGNDIRLSWLPVTRDLINSPITVTGYIIFASTTVGGPFQYLSYTTATSFVHPDAVSNYPAMYYQVRAYLGDSALLESLPTGLRLTETEVMRRLSNREPIQQ